MTIRFAFLALLAVWFALPASGQVVGAGQVRMTGGATVQAEFDAGRMRAPIRTVVAALPGVVTQPDQIYLVTDAAALDDCATGGGALLALCAYDAGTDAFQAIGGGGTSGPGAVELTSTTVHPADAATQSLATGSTDCSTAEFCAEPSGAVKAGVITSTNPSPVTGGSLTLKESTAAGVHTWTLQAPADLTASSTCLIGADGLLDCAPPPLSPDSRALWIQHSGNIALSDTAGVCGAFDWYVFGGSLAGVTLGTGTITVATPGSYSIELNLGATYTWADAGDYTRQHFEMDGVWQGTEAVVGIVGSGSQVSRQLQPYAVATFTVSGSPVVVEICTGAQGTGANDLVPATSMGATTLVKITRIDL